ncbi:MAG: hypothetical protein A2V70_01580 [Planctomycetes bacterium RBG_13_63_9]|nr:MAG: hypothetical protein A2V70_01580 [Planctomycetes bacterium RBG_13_63_9]
MAVDSGWSVRDLLCSATYFVAEATALALHQRLPQGDQVDEVVVTGGGQHNGMLLREIARLVKVPLLRIGDLGVSTDAFHPAAIAVLALFYLDQVPANRSSITKAEVPRLLGRLTPGSPQAWQLLLHNSAGSHPTIRPLRSAL